MEQGSRRLIDLSVPLENDVPADPLLYRPRITYGHHQASIPELPSVFPGLSKDDLPDREMELGCALLAYGREVSHKQGCRPDLGGAQGP